MYTRRPTLTAINASREEGLNHALRSARPWRANSGVSSSGSWNAWTHERTGSSSSFRLQLGRELASQELGCVLDKHIVTPVSVDAEGSQAEGSQQTCDAVARPRVPRGCAAAACACIVGLGRARGAHDCGDARSGGETLCGRTPRALRGVAPSDLEAHDAASCARCRRAGRLSGRSLRSATGSPRAVVSSSSDELPESSA